MTKLAEEYDKDFALRAMGQGIDNWYGRVRKLQRNQSILLAALVMETGKSVDYWREHIAKRNGYGEEV